MAPNVVESPVLTKRTPGSKENDIVIERDWDLPTFTIKEIRDAIPAHCFKRDTLRSFTYVFHDLAVASLLFYGATFIDTLPEPAGYVLWPLYWFAQGVVLTGVWVLAHECGHQAFSPSKFINNSVGWVLHSFLLVPYHSWRISHSKHHKACGNMTKDQVFVPKTRARLGMPPYEEDPEADRNHSMFDETPLYSFFSLIGVLLVGWPGYLLVNASGQDYGRWTSHFHPWSPIFEKHQWWDIIVSDLGIVFMTSFLVYVSNVFGAVAMLKYYFVPYLFVNAWLVLITFLHHTDPNIPHYSDKVWNFQRGSALTIDRSYGFILNYFHHHITDTHVAHHFFSQMPHYHAEEATKHIKKTLGKYYFRDDTPFPIALWKSFRECKFVEDGDVIFYRR